MTRSIRGCLNHRHDRAHGGRGGALFVVIKAGIKRTVNAANQAKKCSKVRVPAYITDEFTMLAACDSYNPTFKP